MGIQKYSALIKRELINIYEDGSFSLNMKYFNFATGLTMTNNNFHELFGGPQGNLKAISPKKNGLSCISAVCNRRGCFKNC